MKKYIAATLILLSLTLLGCASTTGTTKSSEANSKSEKPVKNTARFDDWKYKGFGMPLPEWVEAAIDGKTEKLSKAFGRSADQLEVLTGSGINVDHSEEQLKSKIPEGKDLIEGFWVRLNTEVKKTNEPYITVLIYEK
ncbi:hypothetical protein [Treponema sp. C6A8]|uniref:hypothetical protein n=1 Tax=Treponema sp. C6A8 TaxID=1410609 RepID=UPI00048868E2|nr:hypothetical protein [Treponema sp. C6A8]